MESPQPSASSVRGRTPQESTSRSPSIADPSSSSSAEKPPSGALCSTPVERALPATRTPQFRSDAASTAPPPRSMLRPSGCGPLCTTVTVAPSSAAARAVSRPSTPPPRTTTRLPPATAACSTDASRRSRRAVTPAGSTGAAGSGLSPVRLGITGREPVAKTSRSYPGEVPSLRISCCRARSTRRTRTPSRTSTPSAISAAASESARADAVVRPTPRSATSTRLYAASASSPTTVRCASPLRTAGSSSSTSRAATGPKPTTTMRSVMTHLPSAVRDWRGDWRHRAGPRRG